MIFIVIMVVTMIPIAGASIFSHMKLADVPSKWSKSKVLKLKRPLQLFWSVNELSMVATSLRN